MAIFQQLFRYSSLPMKKCHCYPAEIGGQDVCRKQPDGSPRMVISKQQARRGLVVFMLALVGHDECFHLAVPIDTQACPTDHLLQFRNHSVSVVLARNCRTVCQVGPPGRI